MKPLNLVILILVVSNACVPTSITRDLNNSDKVLVTNTILKTKVLGEVSFIDNEKNMTIEVKPIDTRLFDDKINRYKNDGSHNSIITRVEGVSTANDSSKVSALETLQSKLLDEGLTQIEINTILNTIYEDIPPVEGLFGYKNPDIYVSSDYKAKDSNPFTLDDRYLTVTEITIENNSDKVQTFCEGDLLITSDNTVYKSLPSMDLINRHQSGSIYYEALFSLLVKDCELIPSGSKIVSHLVYPHFYQNPKLKVFYLKGSNQSSKELTIESENSFNEYFFTRLYVASKIADGFDTIVVSSSEYGAQRNRYHFLRINNSISFVEFEDFYLHNDMSLDSVEIITIKSRRNRFEIIRTPITQEDLEIGDVVVVETE
ncbi:MAG: hypothetical protein JJ895_04960 [Balneolaceae bacterium]|nr:hypothetical protein [Balneolaceae bacterium]